MSPGSWGKASPSTGLRAAGGSCLHPLLSCLHWRVTEQRYSGVSSATGASLRCPESWDQEREQDFTPAAGIRETMFSPGGLCGSRAAVELVEVSVTCLHPSTGLPEGPCATSLKLLHVLTPTTRRDAVHLPSITPGWVS